LKEKFIQYCTGTLHLTTDAAQSVYGRIGSNIDAFRKVLRTTPPTGNLIDFCVGTLDLTPVMAASIYVNQSENPSILVDLVNEVWPQTQRAGGAGTGV
jgi:hypothetical protein